MGQLASFAKNSSLPSKSRVNNASPKQQSQFHYRYRGTEFAWFDRSRSFTAGFLDGRQFRARRGITTSGFVSPRILSLVDLLSSMYFTLLGRASAVSWLFGPIQPD